MKTTVEISDSLLLEAKQVARTRGMTLKNLIEQGLRSAIREGRQPKAKFQLRDGSFGGDGLAINDSWPEIRKLIYDELGG